MRDSTSSRVPYSRPSRPRRGDVFKERMVSKLEYGRLRKLWRMLGEVIFDVFQVFRRSARPADPHHGWNIRLTRASISSSSINSPRSACSMPFRSRLGSVCHLPAAAALHPSQVLLGPRPPAWQFWQDVLLLPV